MEPGDCYWRKQEIWILEGSFVELHPNAAGGWFVVDSREPDRSLGHALDLPKAKKLATQIVSRRPPLVRKR